MIESGIVSVTFRDLSPERVIGLTAAAGLNGIEWGGDIHVPSTDPRRAREIGRQTRDAGLKIFSYGSYYRAGDSDPRAPDFEPVLETALALEAPWIRVWAGWKGSDEADPSYRAGVVSDAVRIAELAEPSGIRIAWEFHRNTLTDTRESTRALLREASHPNLYTHWQPPCGWTDEEALRSLLEVRDRLAHIHVFHWGDEAGDRRALAEGETRWRRFLRAAAESPRDHAALMEFVPEDDEAAFLRDAAVLRRWLAELPHASGSE